MIDFKMAEYLIGISGCLYLTCGRNCYGFGMNSIVEYKVVTLQEDGFNH